MSSSLLSSKVVVVTGASSGIGAALARKLVSYGAKVVLAARTLQALQEVADSCENPENVLVHQCDVTRRSDHEALLAAAIARFGYISCWVNNAGVGVNKSVMELNDEDVDAMISLNTKSVLYGMQTSVRYFMTTGSGHLINVSSFLGRCPVSSIRSMYSASKAAVNSLTANMRMDMKAQGYEDIHIALFSPGLVGTPFGLHSKYGGPDNNRIPGAQDVQEVAEIMARMIEVPSNSVDLYSRDSYKDSIIEYFSAPDIRVVEAKISIPNPASIKTTTESASH
jgi:NADP-dependent 3-hydroxy acid dehydrogenase YdfG